MPETLQDHGPPVGAVLVGVPQVGALDQLQYVQFAEVFEWKQGKILREPKIIYFTVVQYILLVSCFEIQQETLPNPH